MKSFILHILVGIASLAYLAACKVIDEAAPADSNNPTAVPVQGEIRVDLAMEFQALEGFGASGAWWAQDVGGWEDEAREQIVKLLFDQEDGIGLSIYRYNIGGGDGESIPDDWRRSETFGVEPGVYDWSQDANALWFLKAAQDAGVEHFVAFANSPPAWMTVSGRTNGEENGSSNLAPEMYAEFADYLVNVVRHLQDEGIPIKWLSPINEPQWNWSEKNGQEGCHYEPDEVAAMTKVLIQAVDAAGLDVKISVFESGEWKNSTAYVDALLGDPEIAPHLDHLAVHSYWSDGDDKARLIRYLDKNYPGIPIEMTEWTEMEQGRGIQMDSGLLLANTVYEDLTVGRVISWQYWIAVSKYNFHDGLIYVALNDHEITETKRLWTLGNFSRFVRPGFKLMAAESDLRRLRTTAFQSPDGSELVLVVINNDEESATVGLRGIPGDYSLAVAYETSKELNLSEIFSGESPLSFEFAPKSVTTLVFQK